MAILNKIQVKGVQYEIEDSNAIHGTLKTVNGTSLHGDGDIVTVGKVTEQNGEIFNDYENNTANGTYSSSIGNSTVANNFAEHASGQFNVSNSGAEGKNNTISSIGIGTANDARKNAFEVMRNGDLHVYGIGDYDGTNPIQTNSLQTIINQSLDNIESKVDKTTTVNGKPLSSNVVISGTDIVVGGTSDYRTDSLAEALQKIDDFIGDAESYAVTSFGGQTGNITLQLDSETNGEVNFTMFNKELRGTVVGLKSAAYTEAQDYATAAQGLKADSAVQSVRESNTGTNISILASKTGNVINLTPSLTISTVSSNGTGLTTAKDVKSYVDTSINNLDKSAVTAGTGQVISSVSQSNGIVSASVKTLAEADIPTLSQSKISGLSAALNAKQDATVSTLPTTSKTISGAITEIFNDLTSHTSNTSNPHNVTKAQIGLSNVDNTSDANKPISTATQNALNTLTTTVNGKQNTITGAASTVTANNLTASRALISDTNGKIAVSTITSTELGYLDGVTSNVQTQLNAKQATITGGASTITSSNLTANRALVSNSSGKVIVSTVTSTELGYLDGVTSSIQTQLNNKSSTSHTHSNYALTTGTNASGTWPISISGKAANTDALNNEVIQYVGADRGIPYRFKINLRSAQQTYIKLGTLPLPVDVGSKEGKVIFFIHGGINFGSTSEAVYVGTASTRGSINVALRRIIGRQELKIGYVTTSTNVEIWLYHTNNYLGTTTIDVVASNQFNYTMQPTSTAPSNAVWFDPEQIAVITDNVASATTATTLSGLTATVGELNFVDGVTSNIQTQLNGKASSSHTHQNLTIQFNGTTQGGGAYNGSTARTINITPSAIGAATSSHTHTASQVSGLAAVATSGNYNDLINKPNIPEGTEVDTALSTTSVNPVQNKVVTAALNTCATRTWVQQQGYLTTPYTLPTASSSVKGGITLGYSSTGKNYAVVLDSNGRAYVNVPWTDNNTTYSPATASVYGLVKIGFQESGKNYPVELNSSGQMYVNVPWTDTNTTYGVATTSSNGLMSAAMVTKLNGIATGANNYTHPSYTARSSGLYKITVNSLGHVSSATAVSKNDIVALGIPASDTNTHYTTHLYAGTSSGSTNSITSNGNTHLILTDDSTVRNRVKLTGSGATTVSSDANGNITISSTNTTYSVATTSSAGLMSAADKVKLNGIQAGADAVSISRNLTSGTQIASITINGTSTALYAPAASTSTDTKNTTGTSNSTSKLYLAGGTTQSDAGVLTYSNVNVYTQAGNLYATQMNSTNGFYETSDARLKDFKDDIKALDVVSEIPTKYFTWKLDESQKQHIGTSAQEIQKIYPDLVTENEDGVLSVDYARLSIIALAAIKELKEEIEKLKNNK